MDPSDANYKFSRQRQLKYLEFIRSGMRRGEAAKAVGMTRQQVANHCQKNPEFKADIDKAEVEACDVIEGHLRKLCETEGRHQLHALKFWLQKRDPDRWGDVKPQEQSNTAPADPAALADELKRLLKPNEDTCS